ncbi:MAG: Crp/Fnr family transcriptional regulator [Rhodospirillaceae bacterium]
MKRGSIEAAWVGSAQCEGCGIREMALFKDLQKEDFDLIHLPIEEVSLKVGEALYEAEDAAEAVFTLRVGLVKLVAYLPDGLHRIVRLMRPGDTIGMEAMVGERYEHSAVALQPSEFCRIPTKVVDRLSAETPRLHRQLMDRWHRCVREADNRLIGLSTGSAKSRVARLVLDLPMEDDQGAVVVAAPGNAAHRGPGEPGSSVIRTLFGREDMGAMLGVTTETASRMIADLRRSGALQELGGNRVKCNDSLLREFAGES